MLIASVSSIARRLVRRWRNKTMKLVNSEPKRRDELSPGDVFVHGPSDVGDMELTWVVINNEFFADEGEYCHLSLGSFTVAQCSGASTCYLVEI